MAIFSALQTYIDRGLLLAMLQQDALAAATDTLGDHRWDADTSAGTITFTSHADPSRQLTARAHLLASVAPGPGSVLWSWAHPQGDANGVTTAIREAGMRDGVRELVEGEVPFPAGFDASDAASISALAHEIGQTAAGILGRGPYYSAPVDGGTRFVFLLEAPLPQITLATTLQKLPRLLSSIEFNDARTSVWSLATMHGWQFAWTDNVFGGAQIADATGSAHISFDQAGRITGVQGSAHAQ